MTPDEAIFRDHLTAAPFCSGADRGRWGLSKREPQVDWPHCFSWVQSDTRFAQSGQVALRFKLDGYPVNAPNAIPWDSDGDQPLAVEKWPKGPGNVSKVFNPGWNASGLYCPADRIAIPGHDAWKTSLRQWCWIVDSDITLYLEFLHRCLNPRDHEA